MEPGDLIRVVGRTSRLLGKLGVIIEHDVGPWRWWIFSEGEIFSVDSRTMELINEAR